MTPPTQNDPNDTERAALLAEMWALEDAPRDDGLGDVLKADLVARIERRLDVIGRG